MIKIDMNSQEFKTELEKTGKFTDKVCESFGWVYNPIEEVNEGVTMGLARNKIIYNKRYCPCFMVQGETKEEQKKADNRICPCKPAIEKEIPNDGKCHCGIFCTQEYTKENAIKEKALEVSHTHSRGLTKDECEALLKIEQLDSHEIESLLEARALGFVEFSLVDVREYMEYEDNRIEGTDYLVPTTTFYQSLSCIEDKKEDNIVLYCLTGSRSVYCQEMLKDLGWKKVSNYTSGIIDFTGKTVSGK